MSVRAASLLVALGVVIAASVATRMQESPKLLAEAFVRAANASDRGALERLVHPDVVAYLEEQDPERWEQVLAGWAGTRFEAGYDVVVRPSSEVDLYDEAQQTLVFGDRLRFRFPVQPPSHFLIIQIKNGSAASANDERPLLGSNAVEAVREDGGRWYVTVPVVEILPDF
jgi:hypothetical protein